MSYNGGNISNRESKNEFSFGVSYSRRAKKSRQFDRKGFPCCEN